MKSEKRMFTRFCKRCGEIYKTEYRSGQYCKDCCKPSNNGNNIYPNKSKPL